MVSGVYGSKYELAKQRAKYKLRHADTFENRKCMGKVSWSLRNMVPSMFWGLEKAKNMKRSNHNHNSSFLLY